MIKSVSGLFLLLGFCAAMHFQKREGVEPIQVAKADEMEVSEISTRDDLLDVMIATGAMDHKASHKDETSHEEHHKEIEESLLAAVKESSARLEIGSISTEKLTPKKEGPFGLVWVHGAGFYEWKQLLDMYLKFPVQMKFPRAPKQQITAWGRWTKQARSWFDMTVLPLDKDKNPPLFGCSMDDVHNNIHKVRESITDLIDEGVPASNIVVGGMAQGGYMALRAATTFKQKLGGVFVYNGMMLDAQELKPHVSDANKDIPIEWLHGSNNDVLLPSMQQHGIEELEKIGFHPVKTSSFAHHTSHPDLYERLKSFLYQVL